MNNALSFGAVAKALRALDETPVRPPEGYVGLDYPPSMSSTGWSGNRGGNEEGPVRTLNKKASGVSGLGPVQLKAMKQNDSFVKYLTQAYNELTTHPEADGHEHLPPR